MVFGTFDLPERRYAAGACFLRGQGSGRVTAVHGWDRIQRDLGDVITDVKLPAMGMAPSTSYEGEGFILVRHTETPVVERAVAQIAATVRVELG
jgi:hypothetical protein